MDRQDFCKLIAGVSLAVFCLVPIAMCFGFMSGNPERFVHNIFVTALISLITFFVSFVGSLVP